jgi:hypothetical protein
MTTGEPPLSQSWIAGDTSVARLIARPMRRFLNTEAASGIILLVATCIALVLANSPLGDSYESVWTARISLDIAGFELSNDLRHWVNDGLMALFFFVVGLEIKRELVAGELREPRRAALPAVAALGGMVVPALIYMAINAGGDGFSGWGVPMATDIAFAVGVLTLLGRSCPSSLKVLLLSIAIVDDIGAILVIAIFYTDRIALAWLIAAVLLVGRNERSRRSNRGTTSAPMERTSGHSRRSGNCRYPRPNQWRGHPYHPELNSDRDGDRTDLKGIRLSGFLAWLIWLVVHLYYLIGFQNRLVVVMRWTFSFITRSSRGPPHHRDPHSSRLGPVGQRAAGGSPPTREFDWG